MQTIKICNTEIKVNSLGYHLPEHYYNISFKMKGYEKPVKMRFRNVSFSPGQTMVYCWWKAGNGHLYSFDISEAVSCEPCNYGKAGK